MTTSSDRETHEDGILTLAEEIATDLLGSDDELRAGDVFDCEDLGVRPDDRVICGFCATYGGSDGPDIEQDLAEALGLDPTDDGSLTYDLLDAINEQLPVGMAYLSENTIWYWRTVSVLRGHISNVVADGEGYAEVIVQLTSRPCGILVACAAGGWATEVDLTEDERDLAIHLLQPILDWLDTLAEAEWTVTYAGDSEAEEQARQLGGIDSGWHDEPGPEDLG